ncbi:hypothetical protein M770_07640 [Pseudomonas aeruginosa VRFPA03]|nr:hypothetical protein M770_07640 [Pseudomonas aeruginosa VRFPA03]
MRSRFSSHRPARASWPGGSATRTGPCRHPPLRPSSPAAPTSRWCSTPASPTSAASCRASTASCAGPARSAANSTWNRQRGLELRLIDARGDAAQLLQRLDEQLHDLAPGQTPLLSLSAVPTGHGAATALEGVAERIRAHDGLFFLDASHAVGQLPLAVEAIGCDVLVFPPRKWLRGPKGLGVLYLGERALERLALPDGLDVGGAQWSDAFALQARDDARRFECSEFNPGLRLALKASCDYLLQTDVRRIARRNRQLRERIAQQLYRRLGWTPLEQGPHASALMTYAAPELSGEQWLKRLHARGVNASYIGPQYARWALREQALPGVLRLTPHYLTDDGEIERLGEALEDCLRQRAAS